MVGLAAGITFPTPRKPRIAVGYDHLSGNDGTAGKVKVFNTLFATNHKFYGFMDYFLNIPVHTQGLGLRDFMVKAKTRLAPRWVGSVDFHTFRYTEKDAFGDTQLGKEWDIILNYQYSQPVTVTFGASVFFPDKVFKRLKGDRTTYWGFSMLALNF